MSSRLTLAGILLLVQAGLLVLALFFPDPPDAFRRRYLPHLPPVGHQTGASQVEPAHAG